MRQPSDPKNIVLIVLIVIASCAVLLLFLDLFLSVFPDQIERPMGDETDVSDDRSAEEPKKHWWEGIFDREESTETETPAEDAEAVTDLHPTVSLYYTPREMTDAYLPYLTEALHTLRELEMVGEVRPIDRIGLFNLDLYGIPEIILRHKTEGGYYEYTALELMSLNRLTAWRGDTRETEELTVYEKDGGYTVLLIHKGDGDDEYLLEMVADQSICFEERAAKVCEGAKTTYYVHEAQTYEEYIPIYTATPTVI